MIYRIFCEPALQPTRAAQNRPPNLTYQQIMPLLRGITITEFQDFCGMIF